MSSHVGGGRRGCNQLMWCQHDRTIWAMLRLFCCDGQHDGPIWVMGRPQQTVLCQRDLFVNAFRRIMGHVCAYTNLCTTKEGLWKMGWIAGRRFESMCGSMCVRTCLSYAQQTTQICSNMKKKIDAVLASMEVLYYSVTLSKTQDTRWLWQC